MPKWSNEDAGVVINEVSIRVRAESNSPHDAVSFDHERIKGVNLGGKVYFESPELTIEKVNISIDGVSFDCDLNWLMMLRDPEFRSTITAQAKKAEEKRQSHLNDEHKWTRNPEKEKEHPDNYVWQCSTCLLWYVIDRTQPGRKAEIKDRLKGKGFPKGCEGEPNKDAVLALKQEMELSAEARKQVEETNVNDVTETFAARHAKDKPKA